MKPFLITLSLIFAALPLQGCAPLLWGAVGGAVAIHEENDPYSFYHRHHHDYDHHFDHHHHFEHR